MSKVRTQCEITCNDGLMPLIHSLIKPPDSEEVTLKHAVKKLNPYYKKSGRVHNNDTCDACSEGGDLICCDLCPSSFHLSCYDPPLNDETIPNGLWICHSCKMLDSQCDGKGKNSQSLSDYRRDTADQLKKKKKMRNSRKSCSSTCTENVILVKDDSITLNSHQFKSIEETLNPMDKLIRAAKILNPRQFQLPRDIQNAFSFPGSEKLDPSHRNANGKKMLKGRKLYELDGQGLVPLPAKTCHACGKSCRRAPLVACDYCDLFFHQDCLDPPLTALPISMWMCPNHVEQFIDWKLVNSVSGSERVKLWNHFGISVDPDLIKNEFIRKVHRSNPPFRIKQNSQMRDRIEVPPMIAYHYKNPPSLKPSLHEILGANNVKMPCTKIDMSRYDDQQLLSIIDTELKSINIANEKMKYLCQTSKLNDQIKSTANIAVQDISEKDSQKVNNNVCHDNEWDYRLLYNDWNFKQVKINEIDNDYKEAEHLDINKELQRFDDSVIKALAYQRLQQILIDNVNVNMIISKNKICDIIETDHLLKSIPLPSQLLTKADIDRISRKFTIPVKEKYTITERCGVSCPSSPKKLVLDNYGKFQEIHGKEMLIIGKKKEMILSDCGIRVRAAITSVKDLSKNTFRKIPLNQSVYMRYRSISIGSGEGNDVQLLKFGSCRYVSEKHAVIFYDEVTQMFELLNYSEYGTMLNDQLYTCDFTEYSTQFSYESQGYSDHEFYKQFDYNDNNDPMSDKERQEIIDPIDESHDCNPNNGGSLFKVTNAVNLASNCKCRCPNSRFSGWEGTAILHQGAYLKFGCLTFVFTIADYDSNNDLFDDINSDSE